MTEMRRPWRSMATIASVAIALSLCGALLDPAEVARWMAHPARVAPDGSLPETTLRGAQTLRIALLVAPTAWALALLLGWLVQSRTRAAVDQRDVRPSDLSRRSVTLLVAILALASILRVPLLAQSLWYDEIVAFAGYSLNGPWITIGNYFSQANHIFSQLLIWASTALLGADEFSMRAPALLASILSIVFVWGAAREVADDRTALASAAAMAFMPVHALAGSDARGYAIVIGLASLALWCAARARRTGSLAAWTLFSVAIALAAWAHLVAVCFALGLGLAWCVEAMLRRDRAPLAGVLALVAGAALTILLLSPVLPDLDERRSQFGAHSASVPSLTGPETWHALLGLGGAWVWWAAIPGLALAIVGARSLAAAPALRRVVLAAGLGFPIAFGLAWAGNSWLYARFLLFTVPCTALLIGCGAAALGRWRKPASFAALAAYALLSSIHLFLLPPRQPLREALLRAGELAGPRQPVGVVGLVDNPLAYYGLIQQIEVVDLGDRGANLGRATPPRAVVVLYPASLPDAVRETLGALGYARRESLPGWIDWGAGEVEIWSRK